MAGLAAGFSSSPPGRGFDDDDDDELARDTIPCSPYATQATQVINRTSLLPKHTEVPSSPLASSVVEVPASSPFQPKPAKAPFATRLAPAGTLFRPPPQLPRGVKRPAAEPIMISSDDEKSPSRGDIQPTAFKKRMTAFHYEPTERIDKLEKMTALTEQVSTATGQSFPSRACREALMACHNNVSDAVNYLYEGKHLQKEKKHGATPAPLSAASTNPLKSKPSLAAKGNGADFYQTPNLSPRTPSPAKQTKPRRRLVQGRRPNRSPSPPTSQPVQEAREVINVDDEVDEIAEDRIVIADDKDDDYDNEDDLMEATVKESLYDKALNTINNSSIDDLSAMTNLKQDELQIIATKRPFHDIDQVERVTAAKKSNGRKSNKAAIGELLVEAIMEFTKAVNAIDTVVAECEKKAVRVKSEMSMWDIDFKGHARNGTTSQTDSDDLPMTPNSSKGQKYSPPPIPRQPALLEGHCTMRPFQLYGLNWMSVLYNSGYGCILADEMGLGKTCQVISLMAHLVESYDEEKDEKRPWPNLIVVPPSTLSNWEVEFEKFAPDLSVLTYKGSQSDRAMIAEDMLSAPEEYHVVLTSYTQVGKEEDIDALMELRPNAAVFDEGHKMKNPKTKIYKDLIRIKADWRMLLTGTPVQNNLMELLSLLNFIDPKMFKGHMEHLQYMFSQSRSCSSPNMEHLIGELKNCSDFELHLWCRDYKCLEGFDLPEGSWMESGKVTKMLELIHQYQANGDRVLVFSKFAKVIEILREVLHTDGIRHCVLYGATSVEERQGLINEFNENTDIPVFLLTTGAGGTGINLTSANKVIIFDQSDNPQDDIQAENRAHRLGQTRDVEVIRLLARRTIEELIFKACEKKIELANKVTGAVEDLGKNAEINLEKEVRRMLADQLTPP
ncbi:helicase SWR1 [Verticillium dahliae VdLs.17]|uniref:Helicase SWR1 n=1 Tax=Verticillium dahliae (strain VdLs.17 / ATCC MYA-4575 / FGSC 10137) TaxID=498257 RepID=G2X2H0_VERDV|nr:helicase SWR1 [Verticillium dahliae VdLs.17]EGY23056.1 helicase SWR1 [Verticillium dahliae VdLs.17]